MSDPATVFFVILMPWGRVGSNLVSTTLNRTRGVTVNNEPTTRIRTEGHRDGLSLADMAAQQTAQLDAFVETHRGVTAVAGLKLSHRSLVEPKPYLLRIREYGFRPVIMTRRNHLKTAVSQLRAQDRANQAATEWKSPWAVRTEEPKPGPTAIDIEEAIRLTALFAKMEKSLERSIKAVFNGTGLRIEYAELAADPAATMVAIFDYLDLAVPHSFDLTYRKATSDTLSDDICNFTDFKKAAVAAGYSHFLEP